ESKQDFSAHAELIAMQKAAKKVGSWRLIDCDLYVTLEPCAMCAGAIIQSRIRSLYFAAKDEKAGAVISVVRLLDEAFNHQVTYTQGIYEDEASRLLKDFFKTLRNKG